MTRINDENEFYSDIFITPEKMVFVPEKRTACGLKQIEPDDFDSFYDLLERSYKGKSSYSIIYEGYFFRVERTVSMYGVMYCMRKMPKKVPDLNSLGYPPALVNFLSTLGNACGLLLLGGATGSGKTTTISSLLREYLIRNGGFAYTIEDPFEMPLDGEYRAVNGSIGVCKQTQPINDDWGASLRSALRSRPRYIMVGEIRTPATASQCLRAATSGHLVLSTIHANNVADAIDAIVKHASAGEMSEELAFDLLSRGVLGVIHQQLVGTGQKRPVVEYVFANPNTTMGDQTRNIIKTGKINLATTIEMQMTRMMQGRPLFDAVDAKK
ncbi:MAG: Flp pilus assembly complex ATPase component TadA [Alphaproteobacteria bacterium]|nr:Flp pilus assembly complex ATPase component TadA [Alphaproteobacteria bacterium]